MSDTLTPSGLQSSAGLYGQCGVYQFDRNGAIFNPLDLNPYLLFDAETSMIGTLENPTLDLDPSKQETLDVITATRAGTATYTDFNGVIASASPNTVRVDYVDSVPMMLVEPSATNLVTYSEDFSHSSWLKNAVGTGVAPEITLNAAESPDGTQNATKVVFDAGSGTTTNDLSTLEDIFSATNGASYTQSIYLKGETGGEKILVRNAGLNAYTTVTLTTEWARYEVTETAVQTFGYYSIGIRQGLGGVVMNSKITVYAYGAQVETGSVATSLIRTSGGDAAARTRAADDLKIIGSAFSNFYNQSEGTFYVEAQSKESATYQPHYLEAHDSAGQNRFAVYTQSLNRVFVTANNSAQAHLSLGTYTPNALQRVAASYKANDFVGSANGSSETADASGLVPVNPTALAIGRRYADGYHIQGHIKRLLFWPVSSDRL